MEEKSHGSSFQVTYGRIGNAPQSNSYSMSRWDKILREKLAKGYIDVTDSEKSMKELFDDLDIKIAAMEARTLKQELV